jgi:hypothetical protein
MPDSGHLIMESDVVNIDKRYAESYFLASNGKYPEEGFECISKTITHYMLMGKIREALDR